MNANLWKFAQTLPCANKFQAVLKSALYNKSQKGELDPNDHRAMCKKCLIPWRDGYFSVVIVPASARSWKQIDKYYARMGELTKQQKSLLEYLKARAGRVAKYTCHICSFKTRVRLDEFVKRPPPITSAPTSATTEVNGQSEKKPRTSKRSSHANAGLIIPQKSTAVNSDQQAPWHKTPNPVRTKPRSFNPKDFREIQKLLASKICAEVAAKICAEAAPKPRNIKGPLEQLKLVSKPKK